MNVSGCTLRWRDRGTAQAIAVTVCGLSWEHEGGVWCVSSSAAHPACDGRRWHLRALEQGELQRYRSIGNGEYVDGGCQLGVGALVALAALARLPLTRPMCAWLPNTNV